MDAIKTQLTTFWTGLDESRRRVLMLAVVAALTCTVGVGVWAAQPSWVSLSRVTDADTRASVADQLARSGIKYRMGSDGQTLEVLAADESAARMSAAGQHGIVGLEEVDQLDPWVTPFQEQLQKQRMLQGELQRAINGIEGVQSSSVHLNIRASHDFLSDDSTSTAAVTLKSDEGVTLSKELGKSVARLVSHSVSGMTEAEVSVIDQRTGRALWSGEKVDEMDPLSADAAQKRGAVIAAQASDALAAVLGSPDRARISVNVELTTASSQSTVNAVDPDSVTAIKEKSSTEANTSGSSEPSGEPGVQSNQPQASLGLSSAGNSRKSEKIETQSAVTTSQTVTIQPAGEIRRLSAAVFVDTAAVVARATAAGVEETAIRTELERAIRVAVGVDEKRGDTVVVSFVPFAEAEMSGVEVPVAVPWERLASSAVALVAVVLTFAFLVRPLMRSFAAAKSPGANADRSAASAGSGRRLDTAIGDDGVDLTDENVIDLASRLRAQVDNYRHVSAEDVSALVRRETDHSAEVIRRWIRS